MLFEFSKRLLVLSALAGVLYFVMSYPMVFEKVRKYFPFKFNNTKNMLIFNSVVFALVMYFMSFIVLKSLHLEGYMQTPTPTPSYPRITGTWTGPGTDGRDVTIEISLRAPESDPTYDMVVITGNAGWNIGFLKCSNPRGCGNLINYTVNAQLSGSTERNENTTYWPGGSGTVSNSSIRWMENDTVWTKQEEDPGDMMWLPNPKVLSNRWFLNRDFTCTSRQVDNSSQESGDGQGTKSECLELADIVRAGMPPT